MPHPRKLGIDITMAEDDDYGAAVALAKKAGAQATSLSLPWDEIETAPGVFKPKTDWLQIANAFYPALGLPVSLTLSLLDTNQNRLPPDLRGKRLDDPAVVTRALRLLDYVLGRIPALPLTCLALGNEIDIFLGADTARWAQYTELFRQVSAHARKVRKGVPVGAKITWDGLTGPSAPHAAALNRHADAVFATYYGLGPGFQVKPLPTVARDLSQLAKAVRQPKKPLYLLECGCPSGAGCGSSDLHQADFVRAVFQQWDKNAADIPLLSFTWLTDVSAAQVREMTRYYGLRDPAFADYLATLGLRTWHGKGIDKAAYTALREEATRRKL